MKLTLDRKIFLSFTIILIIFIFSAKIIVYNFTTAQVLDVQTIYILDNIQDPENNQYILQVLYADNSTQQINSVHNLPKDHTVNIIVMKDSIDIPIIHEAKEWIVIHDLTDNNIYSSLANQSNYWYLLISGIVTFILHCVFIAKIIGTSAAIA